ncbi:MAG: ABC transporter permease [Deltaproteobacteria bacterium]|nr:ABC transporter permease [Deltaproteobacteria bacterium]
MNAPGSAWVGEIGSSALFAWQVLRRSLRPRHGAQILPAAYELGARSVLLVAVVCAFAGAMLAVQGNATLFQLGAPELLGTFVGYGGVREIFPLVSAGVVGARAGSAIAAEIATLKLGEQLDALTAMAVDPIAYLAVPRFIAAILVMPLVMVFGTLAGLGAAFVTASVQLHVDPGSYLARLYLPLAPFDLWAILIKGVVFGGIIAVVTAAEGFRARGGAAGVGAAANRAVVRAVILGSVINLVLSHLFFGGLP